jgi:hypothetical protein
MVRKKNKPKGTESKFTLEFDQGLIEHKENLLTKIPETHCDGESEIINLVFQLGSLKILEKEKDICSKLLVKVSNLIEKSKDCCENEAAKVLVLKFILHCFVSKRGVYLKPILMQFICQNKEEFMDIIKDEDFKKQFIYNVEKHSKLDYSIQTFFQLSSRLKCDVNFFDIVHVFEECAKALIRNQDFNLADKLQMKE